MLLLLHSLLRLGCKLEEPLLFLIGFSPFCITDVGAKSFGHFSWLIFFHLSKIFHFVRIILALRFLLFGLGHRSTATNRRRLPRQSLLALSFPKALQVLARQHILSGTLANLLLREVSRQLTWSWRQIEGLLALFVGMDVLRITSLIQLVVIGTLLSVGTLKALSGFELMKGSLM